MRHSLTLHCEPEIVDYSDYIPQVNDTISAKLEGQKAHDKYYITNVCKIGQEFFLSVENWRHTGSIKYNDILGITPCSTNSFSYEDMYDYDEDDPDDYW